MKQEALGIISGKVESLLLPAAADQLLPGVYWGHIDEVFSPAYWAVQAWLDADIQRYCVYRLGTTLQEEVCACRMGGYGIPSEVGLAAYQAIRKEGILSEEHPTEESIRAILGSPLNVGERKVRYRFAAQKAKYLAKALHALSRETPSADCHKQFRNWLKENLPGVGLKTASWITRNYLDSDEVAILDIHILRAGRYVGLYGVDDCVEKGYLCMEDRFLKFARALQVRPAILDTLMWRQMKESGYLLQSSAATQPPSCQLPLFSFPATSLSLHPST